MITYGERVYQKPVSCNGILIIGDPHLTSIKPGRRTDENWPAPIFRKLEHLVEVARSRRLATVLLGDLFDRPVETFGIVNQTSRILRRLPIVGIGNVGNHEITDTLLSEEDSLANLGVNDALDVVAKSGPVCEFIMGERRFGVGMTPYGQEIPTDVTGLFPEADVVVWFTHHDIAFDKPYPKAVEPFEIKGCKVVINGHVHLNQPPKRAGETIWLCPGSITRKTVDLIDQVPYAWVLLPNGSLEPVALPHDPHVFDLTGKFVAAIKAKDLTRNVETSFVTLLKAETAEQMAQTADGSLILERIEEKFTREETSDAVQMLIRDYLGEAVKRRQSSAS